MNKLANIYTAADMAVIHGLERAAEWLLRQYPCHFTSIEEATAAIQNPPTVEEVQAEAERNANG